MSFHLTRWAGLSTPGEPEMRAIIRREGLEGRRWSSGPGEHFRAHSHPHDKLLYCVHGSIVFHIAGSRVAVSPGDRLEIDCGTVHAAAVGDDGVVCLEAARTAAAAGLTG